MGSLLPGWDERLPGVPPKGSADYEDDDGEGGLGYFAKLERIRSLRHAGHEGSLPHSPTEALSRLSLTRQGSERGPGGELLRRASLPTDFRLKDPLAEPEPGSPGTPEAAGGGRLDAYRRKPARPKYTWWSKMSSSVLNERPDEARRPDDSKGYVPQYGVTGQGIHYRLPGSEGPAEEEAVAGPEVAAPKQEANEAPPAAAATPS